MTRPEVPAPAPAPPGGPGELRQQPIAQLRRSRADRVIGGVCGGLGRYLGVDPVLLRIAAIALAFSGGLGVLTYLVAWVVIPEAQEPEPPPNQYSRHGAAFVVGAVLVTIGALLLLHQLMPWFDAGIFWALVVVTAGVMLVLGSRR